METENKLNDVKYSLTHQQANQLLAGLKKNNVDIYAFGGKPKSCVFTMYSIQNPLEEITFSLLDGTQDVSVAMSNCSLKSVQDVESVLERMTKLNLENLRL